MVRRKVMNIGIHRTVDGKYVVAYGTTDASYAKRGKKFKTLKGAVRHKNALIRKFKKQGYKVNYTPVYRYSAWIK